MKQAILGAVIVVAAVIWLLTGCRDYEYDNPISC
jgi:hypothetical protein